MINNAREFLDSVAGYVNSPTSGPKTAADRPIRLGTIDPNYTSGTAKVLFDGESVLSQRGYSWQSGYTPVNGQRVYLIPVGQTYLIGGSISSSIPYNRFVTASPLSNTWVAFDPVNFPTASYTKTETGVVKLSGMIKSGTQSGTLFTLPPGFRPSKDMLFPAYTNASVGSILIGVSGEVSINTHVSNVWVSLENIIFTTENLVWNDMVLQNSFVAPIYLWRLDTPQYAKDSYNRIWYRGAVGRSSAPADNTVIAQLPAGFRPGWTNHMTASSMGVGTTNAFGLLGLEHTNGYLQYKSGNASPSTISLGGMVTMASGNPWITATLQNGWVNNDAATYGTAQYYKDPDGIVHVRGLVRSGTLGATILTLPAGYRPSKIILRAQAALNATARIDIYPDGTVRHTTGSNSWFSLDGIQFSAEQ